MKATEFLKSAVEQYREEVSGSSVPIEVPELGLSFHVFPVQPEETVYVFSDVDDLKYSAIFAIRLICGRAKKPDGSSIFDNHKERDQAELMMRTRMPSVFDEEVASRVVNDILTAFPVTDVETAGNESEETASLDSTLTLPKNEDAALTI